MDCFDTNRSIITAILFIILFFSQGVYAKEAPEYIDRGEQLYRTHHLAPENFKQAIACYEKALALKPNDYQILWRLSEIYQIYGQTLEDDQKQKKIALWKKGTKFGKKAAEVNPAGKEGHFYYMGNMGALVKFQGTFTSILKIHKIKKEMDITFELDPDYPPVLVARAQYLTELPGFFGGDEEEARGIYNRILEIDPNFLIAYYYLAELDLKHKRYDEAIIKLNKIIDAKNVSNYANWVKLDRRWAEKLLKEILVNKKNSTRP